MRSSTTADGWFGHAGHHHGPGQRWMRAMAAHKRDSKEAGPRIRTWAIWPGGTTWLSLGPFGHDLRRGGRMRRGDVRAAILALLVEKPYNGYQIIQEIERRSEGLWKPRRPAPFTLPSSSLRTKV